MPHRLERLRKALQNKSTDKDAAKELRESLIEALEGWPDHALKVGYGIVTFNEELSEKAYAMAQTLLGQIEYYLSTAEAPFPVSDLEKALKVVEMYVID